MIRARDKRKEEVNGVRRGSRETSAMVGNTVAGEIVTRELVSTS